MPVPILASIIVHENVHTKQDPIEKITGALEILVGRVSGSSYYQESPMREFAAYQRQSDFMNSAGITGTRGALDEVFGKPQFLSNWLSDQASAMATLGIKNPSVRK